MKIYGREPIKRFVEAFNKISGEHSPTGAWSDFITITACSLSNTVDEERFDHREKLYKEIISRYHKDEQAHFAKLLSIIISEFTSNKEQDYLGDIFCALGFSGRGRDQIFTPYYVAKMMAKVTYNNLLEDIRKKGMAVLQDLCCGAGVFLIAAVNFYKEEGIDIPKEILIKAQDIDPLVGMMSYIQLFLLGCAGCVTIGNSASSEPIPKENEWILPGSFRQEWIDRGYMKRV